MRRTLMIGDPQAPFARVMEVLEKHGALDGDRLAADVKLVSIGDHFDYHFNDFETAGREGLRLLRWLADHGDQVVLMFGNHDAARVMELIGFDDDRFAQARTLARSIGETAKRDGRAAADRRERDELLARFPDLSTWGAAAPDS